MPVTIISKDRNVNPVLISCDKLFRNSHIFVEVVHLLEEIFLQQWSKRIISDWQSEPLIKQNFWPTTSCANHRQRPRESNKNINFIMCALTKKKTTVGCLSPQSNHHDYDHLITLTVQWFSLKKKRGGCRKVNPATGTYTSSVKISLPWN